MDPATSRAGKIRTRIETVSEQERAIDREQPVHAFVKGTKRKRLSKACDACHKSKRRCDGTAPCSNCYFASKTCTYTDSTGRPVPAPRNVVQEHFSGTATGSPPDLSLAWRPDISNASGARRQGQNDADTMAKRSRVDRPEPNAVSASSADPKPPSSQSEPLLESPTTGNASILLDPTTTHELVNLFFAHCNPQRMIIHKPSFSAALSHNTVPSHLVLAVCALAAPLSKTVSALSSPARLAGVPFFQKAVSLMFDSEGHLLSEPSLTTAQSLCLLEMHEIAASHSWTRQFRYFELALQVLEESLEVHKPDTPLLSATNTSDSLNTFIQRECTRRCFWLIQTLAWITRIYTLKPVRPRSIELAELVRLPIDETTFELAVLSNSATSEFLRRPAPRTRYASQFGHVCRILEIYQNMESVLGIQDPHARAAAVGKSRRVLQDWKASLPAHLQFTEDNLEQQVAMFDTSSNTGAWCFCFMHVLHPCCFLAVLEGEGSLAEPIPWVRNQLNMIFNAAGKRAQNSILSACTLWSYSKYSRDDPQLEVWDRDFEKVWGFRVVVVADQWRHSQALLKSQNQSQVGSAAVADAQQHREPAPSGSSAAVVSSDSSHSSLPHSSPPTSGRGPDTMHALEPRRDGSSRALLRSNLPVEDADSLPIHAQLSHGDRDLPSLKSSGLLDSWKPPSDTFAAALSISSQPLEDERSLRALHPPTPQQNRSTVAPSTTAMPVGLNWLVDEF